MMGLVSAYINGRWGAVCGCSNAYPYIQWSSAQAKVVCRQLGLPFANAIGFTAPNGGGYQYGQYVQLPGPGTNGSLPWVMSGVNCTGNEAALGDCGYFTDGLLPGLTSCNGYDAGECDIQAH